MLFTIQIRNTTTNVVQYAETITDSAVFFSKHAQNCTLFKGERVAEAVRIIGEDPDNFFDYNDIIVITPVRHY